MLSNELQNALNNISIDATIDSIRAIDSKLPVWNFFENIFLNKPDIINILVYNIEGEPRIKILSFDGNKIIYKYISDKGSIEYIGNGFKKVKKYGNIGYDLYDKDKFVINMFSYSN